jgi:hypothetical protein
MLQAMKAFYKGETITIKLHEANKTSDDWGYMRSKLDGFDKDGNMVFTTR